MSRTFYAGSCKNAQVYLPQKVWLEPEAWPGGAHAVLWTGEGLRGRHVEWIRRCPQLQPRSCNHRQSATRIYR